MTAKRLHAVTDLTELEQYPITREERLDGHSFTKWHHHRWLSSTSFRRASYEVQGVMRALFDLSQTESPVGTLPDDDDNLAHMLHLGLRQWQELRAREFGPLRNWVLCLAGNEMRLMHPVVLDQVRDALDRREQHNLSKEEKAIYQRLKRLREALEIEGCSKAVTSDDVLIQRMDDWMTKNKPGRRSRPQYQAALTHAAQQRWFGEAKTL
jgi:hypothetical protein